MTAAAELFVKPPLFSQRYFIDDLVAANHEIVDADPEIFPQSRSLNRLPVRSHIGNIFAEDEVDRFTSPGVEDKRAIGRVFRDRPRAFHRRGGRATAGRYSARTRVLRVADYC
jgi:hypothetical protein